MSYTLVPKIVFDCRERFESFVPRTNGGDRVNIDPERIRHGTYIGEPLGIDECRNPSNCIGFAIWPSRVEKYTRDSIVETEASEILSKRKLTERIERFYSQRYIFV